MDVYIYTAPHCLIYFLCLQELSHTTELGENNSAAVDPQEYQTRGVVLRNHLFLFLARTFETLIRCLLGNSIVILL